MCNLNYLLARNTAAHRKLMTIRIANADSLHSSLEMPCYLFIGSMMFHGSHSCRNSASCFVGRIVNCLCRRQPDEQH